MRALLDAWLFHWTPDRAIWIEGRTLSWDARCAGIYAGFALGVLYQVIAGWRAWALPSRRVLLLPALLSLPLLADVASVAWGYRFPANDARYLTGLLFGCALSIALLPAIASLAGLARRPPRNSLGYFALVAPLVAAAFLLKGWQSPLAFVAIEALCFAGFFALAALLAWGLWLVLRGTPSARGAAKWLVLIALAFVVSGCATPRHEREGAACQVEGFTSAVVVYPVCRREVCSDGRIALVDTVDAPAAVDDWAEERYCALRPFDCLRAYRLKKESDRWLKNMVGRHWGKKDERYGMGDAVRHAYQMCLFTQNFGAEFARGLGVAHEDDSGYRVFSRMAAPSNHCCERDMDLFNNEVGISLAAQPGSCEDKVLSSLHLLRHSVCRREGDDYPNDE